MRVQCQKCKDVYDDGTDPEGTLVPYVGLPQVTCPPCVLRLRSEMVDVVQYNTGTHKFDQKLLFPQYGVGWYGEGPKFEAFMNQPIRKFIREFCCEQFMSIM